MAKILTRLRIDEVSAVDRGAGDGVKIMLMKRDEEPYWKREFSAEERHRDAKSGAAQSDGSFPIHNASDLKNAMRAIGRSKNPGKTKAHIRARARALGLTDQLSDAFKREDGPMSKFMEFFTGKRGNDYLRKSTSALAKSVGMILDGDESEEDKRKALAETFAEFDDYVQKIGYVDASPADDDKNGDPTMLKELAKTLGLKEDASADDITKAVKARDNEIAVLKADLTPEEKAHFETLKAKKPFGGKDGDGKDGDGDGDEDDTKKFLAMTHEQRKALMRKRDDVPEYVRKLLDEGEEAKKRLQKLEDERELQKFEKIARDYSVPASEAPALMRLSKVDSEALNKLLAHTKAGWSAAQKAGAFAELGSTGGNGGDTSAYAELQAKAAEYRKAHPELTDAQAFEKVYTDPANREIAKRERFESAAPVVMPPGSIR
jgi:hypothetical protein